MKIFRAPTTTLTNDFCSAANLISPFLWLEDIILQSSVLTNGIDKGQLLGSKIFFSISFEVVSEGEEGGHFTLIVNFLDLIKIKALYTL